MQREEPLIAYEEYATQVAVLMGADQETAVRDMHDMVEFDLSAEYRSLFKSGFGGHTALLFHGTENIALSVRYTYFSDQQTLEAGIRFSI